MMPLQKLPRSTATSTTSLISNAISLTDSPSMNAVLRRLLKGDNSQLSRRYQRPGLQHGERFAEERQHRYSKQRSRNGTETLPFRLKKKTCLQPRNEEHEKESVNSRAVAEQGRHSIERRA